MATGEHWLGTRALELGLVDELKTSDDYLMSQRSEADLVKIEYTEKKKLLDKLSGLMTLGFRHKEKELQDLTKPMFM